jgi:hypothetical protein
MQRTLATIFALVLALFLAPTVIQADHAPITKSLWNHNGSEMVLEAHGQDRRIFYWAPRDGLSATQGSVLFVGQRVGNSYTGMARLYRSGCDPVDYEVNGVISDELDFTLYGAAPVRQGCTVVGYENSGPNTTLRFQYIRRLDY